MTDADVVVLAGDVNQGTKGLAWIEKQFPDKPVIYVPGNHEYYHGALPQLTDTLRRECAGTHVHLLENSSVQVKDVTILGCTLWTSFAWLRYELGQYDPDRTIVVSALEQTISEGQVEILRELGRWKSGRGDIDMNAERVGEQTPLYYAVSCLSFFRMRPDEAVQYASKMTPVPLAKQLRPELLAAAHEHLAPKFKIVGVLDCIKCLIQELRVELDTPNTNDNTALAYAAERRLHDVAAILLAGGSSVNHRFQGGDTRARARHPQ